MPLDPALRDDLEGLAWYLIEGEGTPHTAGRVFDLIQRLSRNPAAGRYARAVAAYRAVAADPAEWPVDGETTDAMDRAETEMEDARREFYRRGGAGERGT